MSTFETSIVVTEYATLFIIAPLFVNYYLSYVSGTPNILAGLTAASVSFFCVVLIGASLLIDSVEW